MSVEQWLGLAGLLVPIAVFAARLYSTEQRVKSLEARAANADAELRKEIENNRHTLNQVRAYYDERIDGHQKEIDKLHGGLDSLGVGLLHMEKEGGDVLRSFTGCGRLGLGNG